MKVIAHYKDGSFYEVDVPQTATETFNSLSPGQAIAKAKEILGEQLLGNVDHFEVEEDFL